MKVVSNSTPLIALSRINQLEILPALFNRIIIPNAVYNEITVGGFGKPGAKEIINAAWIDKMQVENKLAVRMLEIDLDLGEAEAIVLSKELNADYFLVDEKKARRIAKNVHINLIGTLGILVLAKKKGLISNLDDVLNQLEEHKFRFSNAVIKKVKQYLLY